MTTHQIETLKLIRTHLTSHPDAASKTLAAALNEHFPEIASSYRTNPITQPNPTTEARVFGNRKTKTTS